MHGDQIAATWVDINPGSKQRLHRHVPEQVYVIVHGKGKMQVGQHQQEVGVGDLVYIPSNTLHGIENIADDTLTYISAATPAFNISALYDTGELKEGQSV
ncbi:MAG: cupin domain-containing protein [candidate division Zixibacteria bacterium]|nr:cupin domain-containing protein [candidate division Zixibacteria bacterium]NIX59843.1 cupin domain-containing protein [candidate division Zixibacteria bacterium]